ncbi:unnamed protein product [Schistosoma rodhaini]|uniref:SUN domain-containing protein n=1 Tax=Schistosoma mansoni TaxID=6183 RepID=G4VBB5_SCHMA|nr:hypothetical protein Smp_140720 [Schistosoma mansoni]CAH8527811.1 unnamed protein product [Schistosoma rodhaini]|eukprot:XP_018649813.1 hypothetical protein Smp_140720 [Schistosoma mansoni]
MSRIVLLLAHTRRQINHNDIKSKQESQYKLSDNFQQLSSPLRLEENKLSDSSNCNDDFQAVNDLNELKSHFDHSIVDVSNTDGQQLRISETFYPVNVNELLIWNLYINNKLNEIIICPETYQIWLNNQKVKNIKVYLSCHRQLQHGTLLLQFESNLSNDSTNNENSFQQIMKCFNYQFIISAVYSSEISVTLEDKELILDPLQLKHMKSFMNMSMINWTIRYIYHI